MKQLVGTLLSVIALSAVKAQTVRGAVCRLSDGKLPLSVDQDLGWGVGRTEHEGKAHPFALNIKMPGDEDAAKRIPLGRACLKALGKL